MSSWQLSGHHPGNCRALPPHPAPLRVGTPARIVEAVGAEDGRVQLNFGDVSFQTRSKVDPTGDVPMVSLDRAIERLGGRVDLAKLDCEGAEWLLFQAPDA